MTETTIGPCDGCGRRAALMPAPTDDDPARELCLVCVGAEHAKRLEAARPHLCAACAGETPRFYCARRAEIWEEAAP